MAHIPRAFCFNDNMEMLIEKTGLMFEAVAYWGSYYKAAADVYKCPMCNNKVILPAGRIIAGHWEGDLYDRFTADVQVNFADNLR